MPTDLRIGVAGDTKRYEAAIDRAKGATERYRDSLLSLEITLAKAAADEERNAAKLAKAQEDAYRKQLDAGEHLGRGMLTAGAAIGVGLGLAAKAAVDWESAWAGVTKTTSGSPEQMAQLEGQLRKLATTLPATHEEIAAVAEAAGQLGVGRKDIAEFTRVAIAMGVSTNLSADEAATGMARFSNIMRTPTAQVQRLGSTIVALGNDGASTEQEILDMSLRIAGAGKVAGFTEAQVLAIANALSSLGIEAEAGGSSISTVMAKIDKAVADSGDQLDAFAQVAGMSAQAFAKQWAKDPSKALLAFETGLNGVTESGGNTFAVLEDLGITEIRQRNAVLALASGHEVLADSLTTGAKAWQDNSALMNEANKRYDTTASKIKVAQNQVTDFGISLGETVLPALGATAEAVTGVLDAFNALPGPVKDGVVILGTLATAFGVLGGGALLLAPKLRTIREELNLLGGVGGVAKRGLSGVSSLVGGPWGLAIGAGVMVLGSFIAKHQEAASAARELAQTLDDETGALTDNTRAAVAKALGDADVLRAAEELGVSLKDVTDAAIGNEDALRRVNQAIDDNSDASLRAGGPHSRYASDADKVRDAINGQNDALTKAVAAKRREIEATGDDTAAQQKNADASGQAAAGLTTLGDSAEDTEAKLKDLTRQADELLDALNEVSDVNLKTLDTEIAFNQGVRDLKDQISKKSGALYASAKATRAEKGAVDDNRSALDGLIGKAKDAADAVYEKTLKTKGAEAAGRAWDSTMSRNIGTLLDEAHRLGLNETQTRNYIAAILGIPAKALTNFSAANLATILTQARGLDNQMNDLDGKSSTVTFREVHQTVLQTIHATENGVPPLLRPPKKRAGGGFAWPGESFWVGEDGPELVRFTGQAMVTPAPESRRLSLDSAAHGGRLTSPAGRSSSQHSPAPITIHMRSVDLNERTLAHVQRSAALYERIGRPA